ncbi:MAG: glucosyl-3-phosphoglycerate synthase, partial [Thermoleophilaceae bacterium]
MIRPFHHSQFPLELLQERKRGPVTAVLPTREVADTIGEIVDRLQSLDGLIDQILVVDAASHDGTAEIAARLGADVHQESDLLPEFGQALGKGDAMWR